VPLEAPKLDTRTYADLVREARLRIPRYAPEWTDVNDSDPGMTLVQLFAWLTETMLVEMNRIPDRNYIKFLQLLNLELKPAQPATAYLTFTPDPAASVATIAVPAGAQFIAQVPEATQPIIFETSAGVSLVRTPLQVVRVFDGVGYSERTQQNQRINEPYRPLGWVPQPGSALYLGFAPLPPEQAFKLFPDQIRLRVFSPQAREPKPETFCSGIAPAPAPPVTLVWEYWAKAGNWRALTVYDDETANLTRQGTLVLAGPMDSAASAAAGYTTESLHWLRCRLASGAYPPGQEPEIDGISVNVVPALSLATIRDELVGYSTGLPDQRFTLDNRPIAQASLDLAVVAEDLTAEPWSAQPDLLASGPQDRHYTLNLTTGEIRYGNGANGAIPVAGAAIIARSYRYGGGKASNVGPGLIAAPLTNLPGVATVTNERAAEGGRDEEDLEQFKREAPARIRCRDRAVTAADFTALAGEAGGVARATTLPEHVPDYPELKVPGAVTVIIVPESDLVAPEPSADLRNHVCRYLNERRLLTTEVYVRGPRYRRISVEATIEIARSAAPSVVKERIAAWINAYLRPLPPRSTADDGVEPAWVWPFGQALNPTNLYNAILKTPDVHSVTYLNVYVDGRPHDDLNALIELEADQLLYGADHMLTVIPAGAY
jgi:predicted phage baseplate assembly protein